MEGEHSDSDEDINDEELGGLVHQLSRQRFVSSHTYHFIFHFILLQLTISLIFYHIILFYQVAMEWFYLLKLLTRV